MVSLAAFIDLNCKFEQQKFERDRTLEVSKNLLHYLWARQIERLNALRLGKTT
ncbi:MAG: hypothetical protein WBB28_09230 [Crinalium sp.]